MPYIVITCVILFFFIDLGIKIEYKDEAKVYFLAAGLRIRLHFKSISSLIDSAKSKSTKDNIADLKRKMKLIKPLKHILGATSLDYIEIIRFDDLSSINLIDPFFFYNFYYLMNDFVNETFYIVKKRSFLYYPFNQKGLSFSLKARINLFKLLIILAEEIFKLIGGKIYEQSRRFFKGKPRWG